MTTTLIAGHVVRERPYIGVAGALYEILDGDVVVRTMCSRPGEADVRDAVTAHRSKVVQLRPEEVTLRRKQTLTERQKARRNAEIGSDVAKAIRR